MTKKRNPLENPPAASSSDDDDEADSSAGEEEEVNDSSSSEEEEEEDQPKPPSSSAETDSESDTKKEKSPPPATKSGTKRPSEGTSKETNSKRAKKDDEKKIGEDSKKPAAFQRLWTEEDEILGTLLTTTPMLTTITSRNPLALRSLKKKYMGKEKPSFTKPHDQKSYRLCKSIWGPDGVVLESNGKKTKKVGSVKQQELSFASSPNGKTAEDDDEKYDWFEKSFLVRGIAGFGVDESYVKQRWRLVPIETKKKVEEKVKMLQAKEIEFVLQKTEILHEVTSMIAEASNLRTSH
ncbi:unnamed protein product [Brassica oleracea var. botrytis]